MISNSLSGKSPVIFPTGAKLLPLTKPGRNRSIKGIVTAATGDFVRAETNIVNNKINTVPMYPPRIVSTYCYRFVNR